MRWETRVISGEKCFDVSVAHDGRCDVGEVADAIANHVGAPPGLTLATIERTARVPARSDRFIDCGFRRGDAIGLVSTINAGVPSTPVSAEWALRWTHGPLAGASTPIRLPSGTAKVLLGRTVSNSAGIRIDDPAVSRTHAAISRTHEPGRSPEQGFRSPGGARSGFNADDDLEIGDANSSGGTWLNGKRVNGPTRLLAGDEIRLGDSVCRCEHTSRSAPTVDHDVLFYRPPRFISACEPVEMNLDGPPDALRRFRFPTVTIAISVALAAVMLAASHGSITTALFFAVSPLFILGSLVEQHRATAADTASAKTAWTAERDAMLTRLGTFASAERSARASNNPCVHDIIRLVETTGERMWERLWEREAHDPDALHIRIGTTNGRVGSTITLGRGGAAELRAETIRQIEAIRTDPAQPVVISLVDEGHVGFAGSGASATANAAILQLATLHSPTSLAISAVARNGADLSWLNWLPHIRMAEALMGQPPVWFGPTGVGPGPEPSFAAAAIIGAVESMIAERSKMTADVGDGLIPGPRLVVIIADQNPANGESEIVDRRRLLSLMAAGPSVGVHVMWIGSERRQAPSRCGAIIEATHGTITLSAHHVAGPGHVARPGPGHGHGDTTVLPADPTPTIIAEHIDGTRCGDLARKLAPIIDSDHPSVGFDLPNTVGLCELLGTDDSIAMRWDEGAPGLAATIGLGDHGPVSVDLRADGPHMLVAGTTGSGKSELLQTLVCSLAVQHSPARLNFLFVDYKGGSAFAECTGLPHVVGLVTNLDKTEVRRVLVSLNAEIERRMRILAVGGFKDIKAMERVGGGKPDLFANLVIIVDEFASLVADVPEFVAGIVDIAQRGRSLGLHLVMATQRPRGVITDAIRANTNIRIALRVADDDESDDVVASPIAATLPVSAPGRAVIKVGAAAPVVFQTAYAAGTTLGSAAASNRISVAALGSARRLARAAATHDTPNTGTNDIASIVKAATSQSAQQLIAEPRRVWLAPLPRRVEAGVLPRVVGSHLIPIGVTDVPEDQRRVWETIDLARDGHVLVFGTTGSGKSNLCNGVIQAAARSDGKDRLVVYAIDAGGALNEFDQTPGVGSVIDVRDVERVLRLLRDLRNEITRRIGESASLLTSSDDSASAFGCERPRIVLMIDGLSALAETAGTLGRRALADVAAIATTGRVANVHLIATADTRSCVPSEILSAVRRRIVFAMADPSEASALGCDSSLLSGELVAGRCSLDGHHVTQVAHFDFEPRAEPGRAAPKSISPVPPPIGRTPTRFTIGHSELRRGEVAVRQLDLSAWSVPADLRTFCIFGPPRSGKSNSLTAIGLALAAINPERPVIRIEAWGSEDHRIQPNNAGNPTATIVGEHDALRLVESLATHHDFRASGNTAGRSNAAAPPIVLIDDVAELGPTFDTALAELLRSGARTALTIVATAETSRVNRFDDGQRRLVSGRCGLILQPNLERDGALLDSALPISVEVPMPPGRGFVVSRDQEPQLVQMGLMHQP